MKLVRFKSYIEHINNFDIDKRTKLELEISKNPLVGKPLQETSKIFRATYEDIEVFYLISQNLDEIYLIAADSRDSSNKADKFDWKEILDILKNIPDVIEYSELPTWLKDILETWPWA